VLWTPPRECPSKATDDERGRNLGIISLSGVEGPKIKRLILHRTYLCSIRLVNIHISTAGVKLQPYDEKLANLHVSTESRSQVCINFRAKPTALCTPLFGGA